MCCNFETKIRFFSREICTREQSADLHWNRGLIADGFVRFMHLWLSCWCCTEEWRRRIGFCIWIDICHINSHFVRFTKRSIRMDWNGSVADKHTRISNCSKTAHTVITALPGVFNITAHFTALHGMQTRSSDENSVCPSFCPSNACSVTKRKKDLSRLLYHHLA